ncbi:MAG: DUF4342 domain-containing protein [Anaerolineae bacterium]|jgi:hypothetical protein|nr:DUF4342 domain-containing protein [Anaerolineae bacterium]
MSEQKTRTEEFQVQGEEIIAKVKELVRQGNIRRISITSDEGKPIVDIPLTLGVVGALLLPQFAALGAIAALVARCTITIEKEEEEL